MRDARGIELIENIIIENVKKIQTNTILMGHTPHNPEHILQDYEMTMNETDEHDYGDWAMDDKGAWRISDYALHNLVNGTLELMHAKTPEEKLVKIDFILNVVHMRSDIASWFVEGGSAGLDELQTQTILKNNYEPLSQRLSLPDIDRSSDCGCAGLYRGKNRAGNQSN